MSNMEKNAQPNETDPNITITSDELSCDYVVVDNGYDSPKTDDKRSNAYFIDISNNSSTSTRKTSTHNASSDEVINDPKCHDDNKRSNESFYIDLSSISPVSTSTNESLNRSSTKKSIFSMFIDINDETADNKPGQSQSSHKNSVDPDEKIVSCSYPSYSRLAPLSCPLAIKSPKTSSINSSLSPKLSNLINPKTPSAINSVKNNSVSESKTSRSSLSSNNSPKAFSLSSSESRGSSMNSKNSPKGPTITAEKSIPLSNSSSKVKQTKNSLPKGPLPLSTTRKSPNNYTLYQNKPPQNWLSKYQMTKSDQRSDKRLEHAPPFSKSYERFANSYEQQSYRTNKSTIKVSLDTMESKFNNYQLEDDSYRTDEEIYVKLSDLMRPMASPAKKSDIHMSKSTPGQSLADLRISTISNISFHVENTTSLSRLFPSLSNELSRTSSLSLCSSMYDSNNIRTEGTSPEMSLGWNLIEKCQYSLGRDLLRMFLEEMATDVTIEVSGRKMRAHKCILASRCPYFAGVLGGGYVESAGNIIVLHNFSFNSVYFVLSHIYSGVTDIPDSVNIVELATLTDKLGLYGLKDAVACNLSQKYCHDFHVPCDICVIGVVECFTMCQQYGFEELSSQCLYWMTLYFQQVWPTKVFASLPKLLLDKCYEEQVATISTESFLQKLHGCEIIVRNLSSARWSHIIRDLCHKVTYAASEFAATKLKDIIVTILSALCKGTYEITPSILTCVTLAIQFTEPQEIYHTFDYVADLWEKIHNIDYRENCLPDLLDADLSLVVTARAHPLLIKSWYNQCEGVIARFAHKTVTTQRHKDIRDRTNYLSGAKPPPRTTRKPAPTCSAPKTRTVAEQVRATFVPYTAKPPPKQEPKLNKTSDVGQAKGSVPVRMTKIQTERMQYNRSLSEAQTRKSKSNTRVNRFENTKSRYMETRTQRSDKSSESTRSPRPVMRSCDKRTEPPTTSMSQDSLATKNSTPPPDKYSTFTKYRRSVRQEEISKYTSRIPVYRNKPRQAVTNGIASKRPQTNIKNGKEAPKTLPDLKVSSKIPVNVSSSKNSPRTEQNGQNGLPSKKPVISALERSGTFLKDEPTFADDIVKIEN